MTLISEPKYANLLFEFLLKKANFNEFPDKSAISIWEHSCEYRNIITDQLYELAFIKTQNKSLNSPSNLYSLALKEYIEDLNLLPSENYTKYLNFDKIETFFCFKQNLTVSDCIQLLSRT